MERYREALEKVGTKLVELFRRNIGLNSKPALICKGNKLVSSRDGLDIFASIRWDSRYEKIIADTILASMKDRLKDNSSTFFLSLGYILTHVDDWKQISAGLLNLIRIDPEFDKEINHDGGLLNKLLNCVMKNAIHPNQTALIQSLITYIAERFADYSADEECFIVNYDQLFYLNGYVVEGHDRLKVTAQQYFYEYPVRWTGDLPENRSIIATDMLEQHLAEYEREDVAIFTDHADKVQLNLVDTATRVVGIEPVQQNSNLDKENIERNRRGRVRKVKELIELKRRLDNTKDVALFQIYTERIAKLMKGYVSIIVTGYKAHEISLLIEDGFYAGVESLRYGFKKSLAIGLRDIAGIPIVAEAVGEGLDPEWVDSYRASEICLKRLIQISELLLESNMLEESW